ncbi:hypothetical protein [Rhodococcus koreensis]
MTTRSSVSRPWAPVAAAGAAVAACAVCCAGPLLTLLAGIGVVSAGAALWMPALATVAVAAGLGAVIVRRRRRRACRTPAGPVDLNIPTLAIHRPDASTETRAGGAVNPDR